MLGFNRRGVLRSMAGTGMVAMTTPLSAATGAKPFFARVGLPIGLQLYTLGEEAGRDLDATFAQVAAIGYRELELPGLLGRTPAEVGAAAKQAGLSISSLHLPVLPLGAPGLTLMSAPAEIADVVGTLGAKRVAMPIAAFPDDFRFEGHSNMQAAIAQAFAAAGEAPWQRTAAVLNRQAAALQPFGISVSYHNHNIEFAPIGQTTGWRILLRDCDPGLVAFEIDTGWLATAGLDPVAFLKQHSGRVAQLHVKDVAADNPRNYTIAMNPTEIGAGRLDWANILPAAYEAGVRHFYVEQETPFAIPRIEAITRSHRFLASLVA